jgi:hypothetical protein
MGDEETLEEVLIELGECEEREQLIWRSMQDIRPEVRVPSPVPPVPAPRTGLSLCPINTGAPACPALPEFPPLSLEAPEPLSPEAPELLCPALPELPPLSPEAPEPSVQRRQSPSVQRR